MESKIYSQIYESISQACSTFNNESKILKNIPEYEQIFKIKSELNQIYTHLIKNLNSWFFHNNMISQFCC